MAARLGFDELTGDTHATARLAHATFQYVTDAELAGDLLGIDRFALVGERRVAGDDEKTAVARQGRDDVLDDAVNEIILFRVAAEIDERQNRDRRLVGNSRRRLVRSGLGGIACLLAHGAD